MSNRRVEVLCRYLSNLNSLGFQKDDVRVKKVIDEIEKELELVTVTNVVTKNPNKALLVAIKDITGSIGQFENEMFNEYYQLALKEINHKYSDVKEVYITHHTEAEEVDKDNFFKYHGEGGTIVSCALRKLKEYLDTDREVIVIQFSDGDNLTSDCPRIVKLMNEDILPNVKYYKYFEANVYNRRSTIMESAYSSIKNDIFSCVVAKRKDDSLTGIRFGEELHNLTK